MADDAEASGGAFRRQRARSRAAQRRFASSPSASKARKAAWQVAGAAAALFVVAAAVELWGVHHQLGLVRAERDAHSPARLPSTMVGRTTVDATYRHLTTLSGDRAHGAALVVGHLHAERRGARGRVPHGDPNARRFADRRRAGRSRARACSTRSRRPMRSSTCKAAAPVRRELQEGGTARSSTSRSPRASSRRTTASRRRRPRRIRVSAEAGPMKWSTMSARDRRAVVLGARRPAAGARCTSGACGRIRRRSSDARDQLATERATLARERAAIATARRNPQLQHIADSAMRAMRPRLFEGKDDVMASAELASYLGDVARKARVWLQDAAHAPATPAAEGVRTLRVEIRAESDLLGTLMFLQALERGDKLVRDRSARHLADAARRREGRRRCCRSPRRSPGSRSAIRCATASVKTADRRGRAGERRRHADEPRDVDQDACDARRARRARRRPSVANVWALVARAARRSRFRDRRRRQWPASRRSRAVRSGRRRTLQAAVENDLFASDRSAPSAPYRMPGETCRDDKPAVEPMKPIVLGTAVATDGRSFATVQLGDGRPTLVHVGDKIGEWVVKAIERGKIVLVSTGGIARRRHRAQARNLICRLYYELSSSASSPCCCGPVGAQRGAAGRGGGRAAAERVAGAGAEDRTRRRKPAPPCRSTFRIRS